LTTHGCIRLSNDDIGELYDRIRVGTPVRILYETVKLGRAGDELLVEVHPDLYARGSMSLNDVLADLLALGVLDFVDRAALETALREARGLPVPIGTLPEGLRAGVPGR
jgi:L,D-transpeptidase ErfK/SrfK